MAYRRKVSKAHVPQYSPGTFAEKLSGWQKTGRPYCRSSATYRRLIRELSSLLPEDDIAVEEAVFMSVDEILGNKE